MNFVDIKMHGTAIFKKKWMLLSHYALIKKTMNDVDDHF